MSAEFSVAIHAYVLMTNHVHILATPSEELGASRMMQQLVQSPEEYRWSSYRANALGYDNDVLTPHREILGLADEAVNRHRKYRRLFGHAEDNLDAAIRAACHKGVTLE